ncbi:uncharacterized protein LY89DRAFT_669425 [Mollisia scopiformis]|uniref:Uncharacterized protein n=1 Tax=Mollisia scopiformis TaxID=149040 RepID=A0A194X9Z5_MOLSC|nr:uncharacterized protein LY89DRAFT_669425 [Mollisia scopiformis]KUJ16991.1 hypothetical protein LY89DRAFT_669425 [Mollisia scopiformis]
MTVISPLGSSLSLLNRLDGSKLPSGRRSQSCLPTNNHMAAIAAVRWLFVAMFRYIFYPKRWDKELIADLHKFEQTKYQKYEPQLVLNQEDAKKRSKELANEHQTKNRTKIDVDDGPFCCGDLRFNARRSTMSESDPKFVLVNDLLEALNILDKVQLYLGEVSENALRTIKTVYKVNLYGPLAPFDPHSTWLYAKARNGTFYAFMYCETLQPFSSVDRYMSVTCEGEHSDQRQYRIGVYDADWITDKAGKPEWGTFGDRNLDKVMAMPAKLHLKLEHTTLDGYFEDMVQEAAEVEQSF